MPSALVIGASSGIGEAVVRLLLVRGWSVVGMSRRASAVDSDHYQHVTADVRAPDYRDVLAGALDRAGPLDACIYAAGIGHLLDVTAPDHEADVFTTNLVGAVITTQLVLPRMVARKAGHFIGLSSQADRLLTADTPSYSASKAGLSMYLEGLGLACKRHGVAVTNLRLGFVDTAMSRGQPVRPFLISAERAASLVERCLERRPIRLTFPWRIAPLVWLIGLVPRLRVWLS
jgi:NAD(P)-dependent dehydrogenase (short-subunit alcohol dehydrogenase family)